MRLLAFWAKIALLQRQQSCNHTVGQVAGIMFLPRVASKVHRVTIPIRPLPLPFPTPSWQSLEFRTQQSLEYKLNSIVHSLKGHQATTEPEGTGPAGDQLQWWPLGHMQVCG